MQISKKIDMRGRTACGQERIRLLRIETVRGILGAVQTEPVGSCEPYLIAVHVIETASLSVKPVVVVIVSR